MGWRAAAYMRFCTSTCFSLRSYSWRIFCFSASTIRSFSMLNSSSAFSLISEAFSEASCWMNLTICEGRGGNAQAPRPREEAGFDRGC